MSDDQSQIRYEFKLLFTGDGRPWELIPVSNRCELTPDQVKQLAQILARQPAVVEVRYNVAGSPQGNYVRGLAETRQQHQETLKGVVG
jgi:hypothetical protein